MGRFSIASPITRVAIIFLGSIGVGLLGNLLHPQRLSLFDPVYSAAEIGQCSTHSSQTFEWQALTVEEAIELCNRSNRLLIGDLRSAFEFAQAHIPKAVHLPCHGEKGQAILSGLDPSTVLLLYDQNGTSLELQSAIEAAIRNGLQKVYILQGGFKAWSDHGAAESGLCNHCKL